MSRETDTEKRIPRTTLHRWRKTGKAVTDAEFNWIANRCRETNTVLKPAILVGFGLAVGSKEERWEAALLRPSETTGRRRSAGGTVVICPCCGHTFHGR